MEILVNQNLVRDRERERGRTERQREKERETWKDKQGCSENQFPRFEMPH